MSAFPKPARYSYTMLVRYPDRTFTEKGIIIVREPLDGANLARLFASVYGRASASKEVSYWLGRSQQEKLTTADILTTMRYFRAHGKTHG
jgi:hypothetical protein